ncbi:UNVERIFIED_CONTAM: hypothetical protein HDU68_010936 [Siphonaria sp. JEL0065]|nr:hypothetical protein HDU68_010936 [Siphonaria sp. JEL0065]
MIGQLPKLVAGLVQKLPFLRKAALIEEGVGVGLASQLQLERATVKETTQRHQIELGERGAAYGTALGSVREALRATVAAADGVAARPLNVENRALDLVDFRALGDHTRYSAALLKTMRRHVDSLAQAVDKASIENKAVDKAIEDLHAAVSDLLILDKRIALLPPPPPSLSPSSSLESIQTIATPNIYQHQQNQQQPKKNRKKTWASPVFKTPAETLTDEIVANLAKLRIYPNPLVSTLNPNAHVFVLNTHDDANSFVSTVVQTSARNNNAFSVIGLDVEFYMQDPVLLQLAFSAEIIALFQLPGICSLSSLSSSSSPSPSSRSSSSLKNSQSSYSIDPDGFPLALKMLLESTNVRKSGVAIFHDCLKILKLLRVETRNLSDCQEIAASMNVGARSLASIYFTFVDQSAPFKKVSKDATGFSWESPELEPAAIEYAANDALASLLVYRAMVNQPALNVSPWDKKNPSFAEYDAAKEEKHWKEFQNVRDQFNLTSSKRNAGKQSSLNGMLPSANLMSESDMMLSFTELPSDLSVPKSTTNNASKQRQQKQQQMHQQSTASSSSSCMESSSADDSPDSVRNDLLFRWNRISSNKIKKTTIHAIPLELEHAMFQALIASRLLSQYIDDNKPIYLFAVAKILLNNVWDTTEKYLDPKCDASTRTRVLAFLATKSVDAQRIFAFEVIDMWFKKHYLVRYRGGNSPTGLINKELAIDLPELQRKANFGVLVGGLETLSPSTASSSKSSTSKMSGRPGTYPLFSTSNIGDFRSELIQVWNQVNPTNMVPTNPSDLPPIGPEFEIALFKAVVASGELHGFINQDQPASHNNVFVFYLMKVIMHNWSESRKFLPFPSSPTPVTEKLLSAVETGPVTGLKRSLSIAVIDSWYKNGLVSTFKYLGGVPSVAIGSDDNETGISIIREYGPRLDTVVPLLSLRNKTIQDVCDEYNSMDPVKIDEWRLSNFKFAAVIKQYEVLIVAFERKFDGDAQVWNKFFDDSFRKSDWKEDGERTEGDMIKVGKLQERFVASKMDSGEFVGAGDRLLPLFFIYRIVRDNRDLFMVQGC